MQSALNTQAGALISYYIIPVLFLILGIQVLLQYERKGEPTNLLAPKVDGVVGAAIRRTVSRNRSARPI